MPERETRNGAQWPPDWLIGSDEDELANLPPRPRTRRDCVNGPRPCAWVGCRYHLFLEVMSRGQLQADFSTPPWKMKKTCTLDMVDEQPEGHHFETIGKLFGITFEGARVACVKAAERLKSVIQRIEAASGEDRDRPSNVFVRQAAASGMAADDLADIALFLDSARLSDEEKALLAEQMLTFDKWPLSKDSAAAQKRERENV